MAETWKEADMYLPVKTFFTELGYQVHGEVKGIDATAVQGEEILLLEFKTAFNMKLLYQALERQKISENVYVVIPRPKKQNSPSFKKILYILQKLELGLITVAMDSPMRKVDVHLEPAGTVKINKRKRSSILKELAGRTMDGNAGGSVKMKLLTAYREKSLQIACVLYKRGALSAATLVKEYGCDKSSHSVLYGNHYGWFKKEGYGVYGLTLEGKGFLEEDVQFREAINYYMSIT